MVREKAEANLAQKAADDAAAQAAAVATDAADKERLEKVGGVFCVFVRTYEQNKSRGA